MQPYHSIMEGPSAEAMTWERWEKMSAADKVHYRTPATPEMMADFLGRHVEVEDFNHRRRRFTVGVSEGWQPAYLELVDGKIARLCDPEGYASVIEIASRR